MLAKCSRTRDVYCEMLPSEHQSVVESPSSRPSAPSKWICARWALAAVALFVLWQFLTVHYNRGGNWTALFLTGKKMPMPPDLEPETYMFPGRGFDGEMYRYVAHDVLRQRSYSRYLDVPTQRYRRILVPALAYFLVAGYQPWIDGSYIAVVAFFAFLGAYWLARWAVLNGSHPGWALGFLAVPATVVSMDRMTVDIALAAFTIAFAIYLKEGPAWKLFVVLLLACLVRETGLLLVAAVGLFELVHRRFSRAALWSAATVPMLIWYWLTRGLYVERTHFEGAKLYATRLGAPKWFGTKIGLGVFYEIFHPPRYPLSPLLNTLARAGDSVAMIGVLLAAILAVVLFVRSRPKNALVIAGVLFTLLVLLLTAPLYWRDVNGYARVLSPLVILVALPSIAGESGVAVPLWLGVLPGVLVTLRVAVQFTSEAVGVLRGLF
ncbi:MAG TPA: hypothetical protein VFW44_00735 [Bryobacteraceae bacterium]|nr:hypothetical protein [Bryobacteraceae bacterium]